MLAPWSRSSRAAGGWRLAARAVPGGVDGSNQTFGSLVHLSSLEQLQNKHLTKTDERVTRVKDMGESLCVSEGSREDQIAYYPTTEVTSHLPTCLQTYIHDPTEHGLCVRHARPDGRVSRHTHPTAALPDATARLNCQTRDRDSRNFSWPHRVIRLK